MQTKLPGYFKKKPASFAERRRNRLRLAAKETKDILPSILSEIPTLDTTSCSIHHMKDLAPLKAEDCPGYELPKDDKEPGKKGTRIRVIDQDSFDAALELQPGTTVREVLSNFKGQGVQLGKIASQDMEANQDIRDANHDIEEANQDIAEANHDIVEANQGIADANQNLEEARASTTASTSDNPTSNAYSIPTLPQLSPLATKHTPNRSKPILVLNLANARYAGGGWTNGALAQEEALCYRSSLYLSLHRRYYPIPLLSALYTPRVLLIRSAQSDGHNLLWPSTPATDLPVTSVLTLAALKDPKLNSQGKYARGEDVEVMKDKMRVLLRLSVFQGHTRLVLGALGCGAFGNPPEEVAQLFLDVFREKEFQGGWWEDVVFAVLDSARGVNAGKDGVGNYGVFWRKLDGVVV